MASLWSGMEVGSGVNTVNAGSEFVLGFDLQHQNTGRSPFWIPGFCAGAWDVECGFGLYRVR